MKAKRPMKPVGVKPALRSAPKAAAKKKPKPKTYKAPKPPRKPKQPPRFPTRADEARAYQQALIRLERIQLRVEKGETTLDKERAECERMAKETARGQMYESLVWRATTVAIDKHLGRKNVSYERIYASPYPDPTKKGTS